MTTRQKSLSYAKRICFVTILCILLAVGLFAGNVAAVEPLHLIAAHNQTGPDNPYQIGMLKFKEVVEDLSDGAMTVTVHAGTLGTSEPELVEKLQIGAADVIITSPGFMTASGIKEVDMLSLLYLFENYDHWVNAIDGKPGQEIADVIYKKSNGDFKIIGNWSAGVRHYYGKKPVYTLEDVKGLTIRTQTAGVVSKFWKRAGAIPTSVAWGELYQALQQGVVDSAENAYVYLVQQNHHLTKNGKYLSETAHDWTTRFMLINGNKFNKYSEKQQSIILEAAKASVEAERAAIKRDDVAYKQKAIEEGMVVNELDIKPFIELAIPIQDELAKELNLEYLLQEFRDAK
ncbi:MAG: C4-dicarboxylate ABC transporter substrate-binding protein [Candidatus Nealsonbacteria bacterium]|nr:MAG: C4-dicarboxylate ABC transporter substrate-binding protein [Candidatus Nealsonbacteria bacterium]